MAVLTFKRKVLILGVCIAVLAGTYVLGLVFSPARVGRREAESPLLVGFDRQLRERVAEIRIESDSGSREIVKSGESWILPEGEQEFPASEIKVDAFLDFLGELTRMRLVTSNPDAWEEFEVHNEAPKRIRLLDSAGEEIVEIIVGKTAVGSSENYVRLAGSNEILLANRSFDYYLNVEERFWAYLRIFPEDLEGQNIMRITVDSELRSDDEVGEDLSYTLVLGSDQGAAWKLVENPQIELDNSKVDLLAGNLADLEGSEFVHAGAAGETGFSDPSARILISTLDDRDFRLLVGGDAGNDQYYVTVENGAFSYKVSAWRVKSVLKSIDELRREGEGE
jgi:hypothetical protein